MKHKQTRKFYDEAFMEVFSNRKIIESLLKGFVDEHWVSLIDFDTMAIQKSIFKGIDQVKRESDLLLTFKLKEGGVFSLFVLLEFQSSPKNMLTRTLEYLTRIYENQMKEYNSFFPVVPMVIYNGAEKWREPDRLMNRFSWMTPDLEEYIPDFRYILIDERRYSDKLLRKLKNAVGFFFLLDKTDLKERNKGEARIIALLQELRKRDNEIFDLLGRYITGLMEYWGVETAGIKNYTDKRGKPMLAQSMEKLFEEGREEGIEQGIEKAKLEDARKMVAKGYPIEDIIDITGLSREEIEQIERG